MTKDAKNFGGTLKQALTAYTFNIFGIMAGTIVAHNVGLFDEVPWAIVVYPPILSARGVIGGLLSGKMSTALHLGTIRAHLFGNTKYFYLLIRSIVVITLEASILMSLIAILMQSIYAGLSTGDLLDMLCFVTSAMALSLPIITPLTLIVSFFSFTHGWNPDIILYPIESTTADLLITVIYILLLRFLIIEGQIARSFLIAISLISTVLATYLFLEGKREKEFTKTIRESLLAVIFVSFIVNTAGITLEEIHKTVYQKGGIYRDYPIYVVYPALIDTIGDVGSVVGCTITTKLALGTLKPNFASIKRHLLEITSAWIASLIMYFIYALLALIVEGLLNPMSLLKFSALLFTANAMASTIIILLTYSVNIVAYKRGFDPDNFNIPIDSASADTATTLSIFAALLLLSPSS